MFNPHNRVLVLHRQPRNLKFKTMIVKKEKGDECLVTFRIYVDGAEKVAIVGDWNGWKPEYMEREEDGSFSITKVFKKGSEHMFRYFVNDTYFVNDPEADAYVPNPYGTENCVVRV